MTARPVSSSSARDGVDTRLAQIEQRAAAATEGPWELTPGGAILGPPQSVHAIAQWVVQLVDLIGDANAAFITAARADVPWLVAQLCDARAENRRLIADRAANEKANIASRRSLCEQRDRIKAERDRAEAALAAVRELHFERKGICWECNHDWPCATGRTLAAAEQDEPKRLRRYDQCDGTCTVDCGHCKGQGRPVSQPTEGSEPKLCTCRGGPHGGYTCPECSGVSR